MFHHYLKIAFRNIRKYKAQTVISVVGLALGLVCFSMSFLWMQYINSYEDFVPDADRIYLVGKDSSAFHEAADYITPYIISDVLTENLPEIEAVCKTSLNAGQSPTTYIAIAGTNESTPDEAKEPNFKAIEVDEHFINFFGVKVLAGDAANITDNDIVLTESTAKALFGDVDVIGRQVYIEYWGIEQINSDMTVKAIIADAPDNTQFGYDALINIRKVPENKRYFVFLYYTFFRLRQGIDIDEVRQKLEGLTYKVKHWNEEYPAYDTKFAFDVLPLRQLRTEYPQPDNLVKTDYVRVFVGIGVLVIIFSMLNYILTMVSQIRSRSRQMAIRRLSGASIGGIVLLNATESAVLFSLAGVIGLTASFLLLPTFKVYASISGSDGRLLSALSLYTLILIAVGILAVICTTLIVVRKTQRSILQGHQSHHSSTVLDRVSCVLQLTLSLAMIFATMAMYSQIRHLTTTNALGFKRSDIVGIDWYNDTDSVRHRVMSLPMIEDRLDSLPFIFPVNFISSSLVTKLNADGGRDTTLSMQQVMLKESHMPFWELDIVKGRSLHDENLEVMINEAALPVFGDDEAVGSMVELDGDKYEIVGVLANIYTKSPIVEPGPMIYYSATHFSMDMFKHRTAYKLYPGQKKEFMQALSSYIDSAEWQITDIEDKYNEMLRSEFLLMRLLTAIALCGLFVSIMGAYSLISLSLQERRKEMAIRKIHGAKSLTIMSLYFRTYLYSLLIASAVAFPIAIIAISRWLEQYPKHISIPWLYIPVIMLASAILIGLTILSKVYKASRENPADVIKE